MMTPKEAADILNRPEVRGRILKDIAFIEWDMDLLIVFYFTTLHRDSAFVDLVMPRLSFNDKISIIERLPFKKRYKSLESVQLIRQLQNMRNLAAHGRHFMEHDKKLKNANWRHLLEDYPSNYSKAVNKVRRSISRLIDTKEVLVNYLGEERFDKANNAPTR